MVLGDKVNGVLIAIGLRYDMMRHLAVWAALFCAFQLSAHAGALLPSQEGQDLVTVKDLPGSRGPILAEVGHR